MKTTEWRCPNCKTLLGRHQGQLLKLRYKKARYTVRSGAVVEAVCRNCGKHVTHP